MFETAELGRKLPKKTFAEQVPAVREALIEAQTRLREAEIPVAIVVAGAEGAGKGETLNTLLEWMDARGVAAHALGAPSSEEAERPPFYRFWRRLPARGELAIFFGSWYTSPILERVFGRSDDGRFDRELARIVDFERMLSREGILLVKFWLHISKQQQREAFEKLESDPDTAWRVTPADWELHETYDEFIEAASRALRRTNTEFAAWEIVEASDERYRHLTVAERLLAAVEARLNAPARPPSAPEPLPSPPERNLIAALDLSRALARPEYKRQLSRYQGRLGRLARRMHEAECAAVIVFEGVDAAGKGGCIRRITQALDARYYRDYPIAAPSDEERAHPYLWRFWRRVPGRGEIAIFDRSWYGRVLVERIEGFCAPEDWRRAYAEINAFEEQLAEARVLVAKFWLAISPAEQLRRFEEREATGHKRYKLTPEDWRNREKAAAYQAAACDMIEKTSSEFAPWTLVEAEDKLRARIQVLKTLCEALERAVGSDEKPEKKRKKRKKCKR